MNNNNTEDDFSFQTPEILGKIYLMNCQTLQINKVHSGDIFFSFFRPWMIETAPWYTI